jgi:hypothetical protein
VSSDGPHLIQLTRVLEQHGIAVQPVLSVVMAVGVDNVFVGVGTISQRIQLLVPSHRDALAVVAPGATLPDRSMLLVSAYGSDKLSGAAVIGGATTSRQAVDEVGPAKARAQWLSVVDLVSGGQVRNRARYLTEERGSITVLFPPRTGATEALFGGEVDTLASELGVPASWKRVYDAAGRGVDVSITTECTAAGPAARLGLRFGSTTWDRAIDLAKALVDADHARDAAVRMGMVAAALGVNELRGVEAIVDPTAPDVVAWLKLR